MPAVLTHKTIMLLARERISALNNLLQQKVTAGGPHITTLDRQLLAVTTEATRILTTEPRPRTPLPGVLFAAPAGNDLDSYPISKFAVMGSMGPDIPGFSSLFSPGQSWIFDTIHKGTPDGNRELVNAQTCDFIFEFWSKVQQKISDDISNPKERAKALDRMRAYVLGHLCHIGADVISHPYVNDHQWQQAPHNIGKFHAEAEGEMDALVARQILRRDSTRSGQEWSVWWPGADDVPQQFFDAYAEALEAVYQARTRRRTGYQHFEDKLTALDPPSLTPEIIKDGYHFYRHGVVSIGYGYGYWSWWGWLSLLFVPLLALPFVVAALPHGKYQFMDSPDKRDERSWLEFVTTPMAFTLPFSLSFSILIGCLTTHGIRGRYWLGIVGLALSLVLAIIFFATLGTDKLNPGFSWTALFIIPAGLALVQTLMAIIAKARGHRGAQAGLATVFALPLVSLALFFIFFTAIPAMFEMPRDPDSPFSSPGFWVPLVFWAILMLFFWIWLPFKLRDARIPEHPEGNIIGKRFIRLFDDETLHQDPHLAARKAPDVVYPAGRYPLLSLWWEGDGDLYIRSDRYQLVFSADEEGTSPQIVPSPIAPMTATQYIKYLNQTVKQPGANTTGKLMGKLVHADDLDYPLPSGATFSDHGDGEDTHLEHLVEKLVFNKLGSSGDDSDYVLYHATKMAQAVRYGPQGAVPPERDLGGSAASASDPQQNGYEFLHDPGVSQSTDSLMSMAADLGAILCLGATSHLSPLRDSKNHKVEKIYQVFRNWNLDRRRVNEWRTLIAGSAHNEKGDSPAAYDNNMLKHGGPADPAKWFSPLIGTKTPAEQAAFADGEKTTRQLGWVEVLRQWSEITAAGQDPLATTAMKPGNPDNQQLSRAMAYLFDLADPTASP